MTEAMWGGLVVSASGVLKLITRSSTQGGSWLGILGRRRSRGAQHLQPVALDQRFPPVVPGALVTELLTGSSYPDFSSLGERSKRWRKSRS
jgi:hypothetical protein